MNILYSVGPIIVYADGDDYAVASVEYGDIATFDDLDDAIDCADEIYDDL